MKMEFSQMLQVLNFKTKLFLKREQMQVSPVYVDIVFFFFFLFYADIVNMHFLRSSQ